MSPEQAEGREAGPEADVYSLALTLYECWSGENPHRRGNAVATVRSIGRRARPLRRLRPDLPRELAEEIDACLDPRPGRRPSLEDLGGAIEESLDELADHAAERVTPRRPATRRPRDRRLPSARSSCSAMGWSSPRIPELPPQRRRLDPAMTKEPFL